MLISFGRRWLFFLRCTFCRVPRHCLCGLFMKMIHIVRDQSSFHGFTRYVYETFHLDASIKTLKIPWKSVATFRLQSDDLDIGLLRCSDSNLRRPAIIQTHKCARVADKSQSVNRHRRSYVDVCFVMFIRQLTCIARDIFHYGKMAF